MARKSKNQYVNNKKMNEAFKEFRKEWEETGERPVLSNYLGSCIVEIATNLAKRSNFSGYTYKDEMIEDGIENAVIAVANFNPYKYDNPHAYFSMVIWNAFIRRITREKKESYIKHKSLINYYAENATHPEFLLSGDTVINDEKAAELIEKFEKKKKSTKKENVGIERYIDGK